MDFSLYKNRLSDYLMAIGMPQKEGVNISCILPEHPGEDRNPSAKIYKDKYTCFHCDFTGDIYDLAGKIKGISSRAEQFKEIEKTLGSPVVATPAKRKPERKRDRKTEEEMTTYMRILRNSHIKEIMEFAEYRGYGEDFASMFGWWPGYEKAKKDKGAKTLYDAMIPNRAWIPSGVVVKLKDGWKLFYIENGKTIKRASLDSGTFPFPVSPQKTKNIIIVEAEISAIVCILNKIPAIACGGVSGIPKNVAETLKDYDTVTICFDGDVAGKEKSVKAADKLLDGKYEGIIKIAGLGANEWGNDPDDYIKNGYLENLKYILEKAEIYKQKTPEEVFNDGIDSGAIPFKFLGFSDHGHYFLNRMDSVMKVSLGGFGSRILLEIAPLSYWESIKKNKQGIPDWTFIIDLIIEESKRKGPYLKSKIRGTGLWEDNGEIIVSDGEKIICSKGEIPVRLYESKNTYVRRANLGLKSEYNSKYKEDFESIKWMLENISFLTEQDGKLLFGWIITSFFLSMISWRPIVYMKGPSSVGKSWVMNNVVRNILEEIDIAPKKSSTVIGIMQGPRYDSRMTTVDEFEGSSDKKIKELVVGLMTLARDTTTNSKESRYVGTADQEGMSNDFTSMFLFASIVESSKEDQDVNRITPVYFYPKPEQDWNTIESKILREFNEGLGKRIRYNIVYHRESIIKNIAIFRRVSTIKSSKQRNADQMGTLIAGWYHLEYPGKIASSEEAEKFLKSFDFTDQNERGTGREIKYIMSSFLTAKIRYNETRIEEIYMGSKEVEKSVERSVYEILVELNIRHKENENISRDPLNKALMNYGLRFGTKNYPGKLIIAQSHEKIRDMLPRDFSYRGNYHGYLQNHPDFVGKEKSVKFSGTVHQALVFTIDLEDYDEKEEKEEKNAMLEEKKLSGEKKVLEENAGLKKQTASPVPVY